MQRIPPTTNADKPTDDAAFAKCVAAAAAIISRRLLDFARSPDFEDADARGLERMLQVTLRLAATPVLAALIQRRIDVGGLDRRPVCPGCRRPMQIDQRRARVVDSLVADGVQWTRTLYVCGGCGARVTPVDDALGIGVGSLAPGLTELICTEAIEIPFERAIAQVNRAVSAHVDADTGWRAALAIGAVAEDALQDAVAFAAKTPRVATDAVEAENEEDPGSYLLVEGDGARVFMDGAWHEDKIGLVAPMMAGLDRAEPERLVPYDPWYCGGVEGADAFFDRVLVGARAARQSVAGPLWVFFVGDGAPWLWNRAQRLREIGTRVIEVVDYFHAGEHIGAAAEAAYPLDSQRLAWSHQVRHVLLQPDGVSNVLTHLRALPPAATPKQQTTIDNVIEYFTTNRHRMQYATFAARGWPIGSGAIESACRAVSAMRFKGAGMRWSGFGAQELLTLRALARSGDKRWEDFWRAKPQLRRPVVAALTLPIFDPPQELASAA